MLRRVMCLLPALGLLVVTASDDASAGLFKKKSCKSSCSSCCDSAPACGGCEATAADCGCGTEMVTRTVMVPTIRLSTTESSVLAPTR